jgi:hypothetical protein
MAGGFVYSPRGDLVSTYDTRKVVLYSTLNCTFFRGESTTRRPQSTSVVYVQEKSFLWTLFVAFGGLMLSNAYW